MLWQNLVTFHGIQHFILCNINIAKDCCHNNIIMIYNNNNIVVIYEFVFLIMTAACDKWLTPSTKWLNNIFFGSIHCFSKLLTTEIAMVVIWTMCHTWDSFVHLATSPSCTPRCKVIEASAWWSFFTRLSFLPGFPAFCFWTDFPVSTSPKLILLCCVLFLDCFCFPWSLGWDFSRQVTLLGCYLSLWTVFAPSPRIICSAEICTFWTGVCTFCHSHPAKWL